MCALGVLFERSPFSDHAGRSFGNAAELHGALGDVVDVVFDGFVDLVEELVQADEEGAFDVPMGLLGLRLQVDAIGQCTVEQIDHLGACCFGQVIFCFEHRESPRLVELDSIEWAIRVPGDYFIAMCDAMFSRYATRAGEDFGGERDTLRERMWRATVRPSRRSTPMRCRSARSGRGNRFGFARAFGVEAGHGGPAGLAGGQEDVGPEFAGELHALLCADGRADRDVDEDVVPHADQDVGVAGHRAVGGVAGHLVAQQPVGGVGRHAANQVARVDVLERDRDVFGAEVFGDLVAQVNADVLELAVAGSIAIVVLGGEQMLPCPFGDGDHGMLALEDPLLERGQEAVRAFERESDLGHQAEIALPGWPASRRPR